MKILINKCHGCFEFSPEFEQEIIKRYGNNLCNNHDYRTNPAIIELFEELGSGYSSGEFAKLKLTEIPDDVNWIIQEYDGLEHVAENHRTWH
jgi:hypothetical protein